MHAFMYRDSACSLAVILRNRVVIGAHLRGTMAQLKLMLRDFGWDERFRIRDADDLLTPALILYPEIVAANIEKMLSLLGGDGKRWRAHLKTAKLGFTLKLLLDRGVTNFKCATTLELLVACQGGAKDVL